MVRKVSVDGPFCFGAGHLRAISPGIVSSLAFSGPDPSSGSSCLAAGSFSGSVGLYDPSSSTPLIELLAPSQRGGVTKVRVLRPLAGLSARLTLACKNGRSSSTRSLPTSSSLHLASRRTSTCGICATPRARAAAGACPATGGRTSGWVSTSTPRALGWRPVIRYLTTLLSSIRDSVLTRYAPAGRCRLRFQRAAPA